MSSLNFPILTCSSLFYIVVRNFSGTVKMCNPLYYKEPKLLSSMSAVQRKLQNRLVKFQITPD